MVTAPRVASSSWPSLSGCSGQRGRPGGRPTPGVLWCVLPLQILLPQEEACPELCLCALHPTFPDALGFPAQGTTLPEEEEVGWAEGAGGTGAVQAGVLRPWLSGPHTPRPTCHGELAWQPGPGTP